MYKIAFRFFINLETVINKRSFLNQKNILINKIYLKGFLKLLLAYKIKQL